MVFGKFTGNQCHREKQLVRRDLPKQLATLRINDLPANLGAAYPCQRHRDQFFRSGIQTGRFFYPDEVGIRKDTGPKPEYPQDQEYGA